MKLGCHVAIGERDYLEDSITVIKNLNDFISDVNDNVNRSYFAVFDGHGGSLISDFLSRQFHLELCKRADLLTNPKQALESCWKEMDNKCLAELNRLKGGNIGNGLADGSTGTVCLIVGATAYIANCGDSSAYAFFPNSAAGKTKSAVVPVLLTEMHSTDNPIEIQRCVAAGGSFRGPPSSQSMWSSCACWRDTRSPIKKRVYPGGLLVTRAFGDFQAKRPQQGGMPGVVIADCGTVYELPLPSAMCTGGTSAGKVAVGGGVGNAGETTPTEATATKTAASDAETVSSTPPHSQPQTQLPIQQPPSQTSSSSSAPSPSSTTTASAPSASASASSLPLYLILASDGVWDGLSEIEVAKLTSDVLVNNNPVPAISIAASIRKPKSPAAVMPDPRVTMGVNISTLAAQHKNTVGKLNGVLDPTIDKLAEYCVSRAVQSDYWKRNYNSADNASCIIISFIP